MTHAQLEHLRAAEESRTPRRCDLAATKTKDGERVIVVATETRTLRRRDGHARLRLGAGEILCHPGKRNLTRIVCSPDVLIYSYSYLKTCISNDFLTFFV